MHHMAMSGCLKMQEVHVEMLLGTLVDSRPLVRSTAINILGSLKLPDLKLYKLTVESLLRSLDMYPKSEAEIFRTLFSMGQNHTKHAVSIIKDFYHEIDLSGHGNLGCNSHRVGGLIVLAVSASLKHEKYRRQIPPKIFSYAVAFFGRISRAFGDVLDEDSFLKYLSHCGDWSSQSESESAVQPAALPAANGEQQAPVYILRSVTLILATVKSLWGLVKSGCTSEVLKALRCCKESLATPVDDSVAGAVAFAFQYVRTVKLLSKLWKHFVVFEKGHMYHTGDYVFEKLDKVLLALRYRFIGLNEEDELYILELLLLSYVVRLSSVHVHCRTLHKLATTIAFVVYLKNTKSITCSDFVNQLAELYSKGSFLVDRTCNPHELKRLCDTFVLKDMTLTQSIRHIRAELVVTGFDSVTPMHFVSGLPVGIPLEITLYNVINDRTLWLRMTLVDERTEFVYLDIEECEGVEDVRQVRFTLPFYRTPKAVAFSLRVTLGMECVSEDLHLVKGHGGPKHVLTYLCPEIELYFVNQEC